MPLLRNYLAYFGRRCFFQAMHRSSSSSSAADQLKCGANKRAAGLQLISNQDDGGSSSARGPPMINKVADAAKKTSSKLTYPKSAGFTTWARWILGSFVVLALPFMQEQWTKMRAIEGQAETVVVEIEHVAEVVEKVATTAEKLSAEIADVLPDHTKVKDATLLIEHISKIAAEDAKLTENFIHKIDAIKQDIDDLAASAEPVVDNMVAGKK